MVITQQIDETHFIIEVGKEDCLQADKVKIMHDYIGFKQTNRVFAKNGLNLPAFYGSAAGATNTISVEQYAQIPIREMIEVIMPLLKDHPYLKTEHLIEGGTKDHPNNYTWNLEDGLITYDGETHEQFIHFYNKETNSWTKIPYNIYLRILRIKNGTTED